jgi:hypothetical protein
VISRAAKGRKRQCRSGKTRFPDHQSAVAALRAVRRKSGRDRLPSRTYECDMCVGWHLTAQTIPGEDPT